MSLKVKLSIIWWSPIHPTLSQTRWVWWTGKWWRDSFRSFWAVAKPGWAQEWKTGRLLLEFTLCPRLWGSKATGHVKEMWKRESGQGWEEALAGRAEYYPSLSGGLSQWCWSIGCWWNFHQVICRNLLDLVSEAWCSLSSFLAGSKAESVLQLQGKELN